MYTLVVLAANKTLRHDLDATAGHSLGPGAGLASSSLLYLLSNIHNVQDGLNTVLLTVSISILGFISLFLFTFYSSRRARSASGSIFEGGVLLKLIVIYQTLNYS